MTQSNHSTNDPTDSERPDFVADFDPNDGGGASTNGSHTGTHENIHERPDYRDFWKLFNDPVPPVEPGSGAPLVPPHFINAGLANGERGDAGLLRVLCMDRLACDHAANLWYLWGGHFWKPDLTGQIRLLVSIDLASAYETRAKWLEICEENGRPTDEKKGTVIADKAKALRKRAAQLCGLKRVESVTKFAQSLLGVDGQGWDKHPGLLPCANGVINLRTGEPTTSDPTQYLRAASPVEWQGLDAPAPRFRKFVRDILDGNDEIASFLQEVFGYGITGSSREHKIVILHGPRGRNGKDTLMETFSGVLGRDLAAPLPASTLLAADRQSSPGAPRADIYALLGRRLVWASETDSNARLDANAVKLMTGGGQLSCRPPHGKRQISFPPTHLIALQTNNLPDVPYDDEATWARILLFTLPCRFVDEPAAPNERLSDPNLRDALAAEAPGILAWLVRGAMRWYAQGRLIIPESMKRDAAAFRDLMDPLKDFIAENCMLRADDSEIGPVVDRYYCAENIEIFESYGRWTMRDRAARRPLGRKQFTQALASIEGIEAHRSKNARYWTGVRLTEEGKRGGWQNPTLGMPE